MLRPLHMARRGRGRGGAHEVSRVMNKSPLPDKIQVFYIDTYQRAGILQACYAYEHLYMNEQAKVAIVLQHFGARVRRSFGVVGRLLAPDEITENMRFSSLRTDFSAAAAHRPSDADGCRMVIPEEFPERMASDYATDVLLLAPEDGAFATSGELLCAVRQLFWAYDEEKLRRDPGDASVLRLHRCFK